MQTERETNLSGPSSAEVKNERRYLHSPICLYDVQRHVPVQITEGNKIKPPLQRAVVGLVWSNDPKSYTGGSVATGMVSHARHVKGDDPDKKGCPGPPGSGLGVGQTTTPSNAYLLRNFNQRLEKKEKNREAED